MSDAITRIKQELESMGYAPVIENHGANHPNVIVVGYQVQNGRFRGQEYRLGISMQGAEMWPEYPPHFIHLSPAIDAPNDGGVYGVYSAIGADGVERKWSALSRPPGPFWDNLPTKSMLGYMEHIRRFWANI